MEGQTIDYITNPSRFKEGLDKAKQEIKDIGTGIGERFNIQGKGTQINNIRTNSNGSHGMDYIQIGTVN